MTWFPKSAQISRRVTTCEKAVPQSNVNAPLEISPALLSAEKTVISSSHLQCFSILKEKWLHIKILLRSDADGSVKFSF